MSLTNKLLTASAVSLLFAGSLFAQQTASLPDGAGIATRVFSFNIGDASYLGVQTENVSKENFGKYNLSEPRGVAVTKVMEKSPAAAAGIQVGDVIVQFEGDEVKSVGKLMRLIAEVAPDQKARITIVRNGGEQEFTVTMGKRDEPQLPMFQRGTLPPLRTMPQIGAVPQMRELPQMPSVEEFRMQIPQNLPDGDFTFFTSPNRSIGISVSSLNKQLGDYFGISEGNGMLINNVRENSPAARAGLRAGDVIVEIDGKTVARPRDLITALNGKSESGLMLTIIRDKARQTVNVAPEKTAGSPLLVPQQAPPKK